MKRTRTVILCVCALWLGSAWARAQSRIVVHVEQAPASAPIPADFAGLSFESSNLLPDKNGQHLFSAEDTPLVDLFRAIGIRNLRVGGGTADGPEFRIPGPPDIDNLFAFAKAAGVRVIYTLRLLNGNTAQDAQLAQYIQQRYGSQLVCFQIGNEPDWHSFHTSPGHPRDPRIVETSPEIPGSAYPSYLADWRQYQAAIDRLVPDARYCGPDTGSNYPEPGTKDTDFNGESWTEHFARDEKDFSRLVFLTQHDYPGQSAAGVSVAKAVDSMLSADWVNKRYPALFDHVLAPVEREGRTYRMTEANDYTGGVDGASNAFASTLWALDYLHWQAAHHAAGVNFHNKSWIFTDTVFRDRDGAFHFNPKAYAIEAFDVGSQGSPVPVSLNNPDGANLTAYAVKGTRELFLTLINKEHGPGAHDVSVLIDANGITGPAEAMRLKAPNGEVTAREGITLGGAPITPQGWSGRWSSVGACKDHQVTVLVPEASAVIVKLTRRSVSGE